MPVAVDADGDRARLLADAERAPMDGRRAMASVGRRLANAMQGVGVAICGCLCGCRWGAAAAAAAAARADQWPAADDARLDAAAALEKELRLLEGFQAIGIITDDAAQYMEDLSNIIYYRSLARLDADESSSTEDDSFVAKRGRPFSPMEMDANALVAT